MRIGARSYVNHPRKGGILHNEIKLGRFKWKNILLLLLRMQRDVTNGMGPDQADFGSECCVWFTVFRSGQGE